MIVFLDVETIPGQNDAARKAASESIKPPGTLKKAESIAAWWTEQAPAAELEVWRRQSLDGGTHGELVSIAACTDVEGQQWVHCRTSDETEAELLQEFFETVETWQRQESEQAAGDPAWWPAELFAVGHNAAFDIGYVWRRSVINRVPMPRWVPGPMARAGKDYGCTMQAWAGFGQRTSLDQLCRALGLPSPKDGGIDGAGVFAAWQDGQYGRIASYNMRDAIAVRDVWHRLQGRGL